jgi:CheY-like chemotaxis protein/anti-sigma regulatory factor (Ser/Thr protein kinase)
MAADQKMVRLQTSFHRFDETIMADASRLQQIVWNLVSNAVKFTPQGGQVSVEVARAEGVVLISISDTGAGIAPEFLPHVFDRFRQADASITRQKGGLGLGLAIVKELVELHGGRVSVHSDGIGKGVTSTVELPLLSVQKTPDGMERSRAALQATEEPHPFADELEGLKVLIVEDETDAREMIVRLLIERGARVTSATSALQALDLLAGDRFELILSDIGMPEMSGYEFIEEVRAQGIQTPAIALTAYTRAEDHERALKVGFQQHLAKPIDPSDLIANILKLWGAKRGAGLTVS